MEKVEAEAEPIDLVWHYTPWYGIMGIIRSGFIRGYSDYRLRDWNIPIVWFSHNQKMELTAGAGSRESFYRIGFPADHKSLMGWPRLSDNGRAKSGVRYHLERTGRKKGANPKDWCGVIVDGMKIDNLPIEMIIDGEWKPVKKELVMELLKDAPEVLVEGNKVIVLA
jgi:hypothetical protein